MRAALSDMVVKDTAPTLTSTVDDVSNAVSSALSAMKAPRGGDNKTETRETQRLQKKVTNLEAQLQEAKRRARRGSCGTPMPP